MCPVPKTSAASSELPLQSFLADPIVNKRFNENIWEFLSTLPINISKEDVWNHLRFENERLMDLVQNYKTMSMYGEPEEFGPPKMTEMNPKFALTADDQAEFAAMMAKVIGKGKAAMAPKAAMGEGKMASGGKAPTGAEILAEASGTYDDAQTLLAEMQDTWFEVQCIMDQSKQHEELKQEVERILALVRSGRIDAVWILIALAKVNVSKNGLLFSQFGRKLWRLNDQATKVTDELFARSPSDPQYAAYLQMTSQKQKELGTQQQFLIQDMQKLTQNIEASLSFARTSIDEIFKTKLHIINAPFKSL